MKFPIISVALLLSGCDSAMVEFCRDRNTLERFTPTTEGPHGYPADAIAFGIGVHAYEVAYAGAHRTTARDAEANVSATEHCRTRFSNAPADELSACQTGVLFARRTLRL